MDLLIKILRDIFYWFRLRLVRFSQLLYYTGREFLRDQCPTRAAAMTYFTMLSLIPLMILVFAIFKASGGGALIEDAVKPLLFKALSPGTGEAISKAIDQLLDKSRPGTLGTIGVIFLLITAFSLMDQLEFNLNKIWSVKGKRSFLQRWVYYWAALSIFPLLVGASVSLSAYLKSIESVIHISDRVMPQGVNLAPLGLQGLAFFLLYMQSYI